MKASRAVIRGWKRLAGVLATRRRERELADELNFHIEMQAEDNLRAGMTPEEALRAARLKFGNVESTKESWRDQRALPWVLTLLADLGYAIRGWRRNPAFTITAVAALALGIGATTAVFSLVNAVLLKPLPFPDPDRLMFLTITFEGERTNPFASPTMFAHWRRQSSVLQDVSAVAATDDVVLNYSGGPTPEQWDAMRVSANYFRCMGLPILRGRTFAAEEERPNGPLAVLIGQSFWARRFASDPAIVGRTISLNGRPHTVIGIVADTPATREVGWYGDAYVPFRIEPDSSDQNQFFIVVARLKPGVTLEQAKDRLRASVGEYRAKFPIFGPQYGFSLVPSHDFLIGDSSGLLMILLCAVGVVLLMACANVANPLLARGASRRREIGIRLAIGAARGRIVRQLLTESLLLSLLAGASGLFLGYGGIRALLAVNNADIMRVGDNGEAVSLDWRVMAFVLAVSLVATVLFGLFPALRSSRVDLNSILKDSPGRGATGFRQGRSRAVLVVSEVALAMILLVGSALLIRSFQALYNVDRGFATKNILTLRVLLTGPKYETSAGVADTIRAGVERIRALPGVAAASATCCVPLQAQNSLTFDIIGRPMGGANMRTAGWTHGFPWLLRGVRYSAETWPGVHRARRRQIAARGNYQRDHGQGILERSRPAERADCDRQRFAG